MDQRKKLCAPAAYVGTVGQVSHFLGIKFTWKFHSDGNQSVSLTQQSCIDTLLASLDICIYGISTYSTPYQPNFHSLRLRYQSLVGSLNWVAHTTRLDLSTVVSLLEHLQGWCLPVYLLRLAAPRAGVAAVGVPCVTTGSQPVHSLPLMVQLVHQTLVASS